MPGGQAPAATRALRVLRFLAASSEPVPLEGIARAVGMPRSSAYHLLNAMISEGFVTHIEDQHRYALGVAAFEVGSGYTRQAPLHRLARRPLADLVDAVHESAHFAVLHGRDVYYVLEERARRRPPLVSDVGVRLPAHLTASGRAMLAALPAAQVRALFPDADAFVSRYADAGWTAGRLTAVLTEARRHGYATEDGDVTPGFSSIAVPVLDAVAHPVAAVAVTYETARAVDAAAVVRRVTRTADGLTRRLGGTPPER
jgi:DNA-binding IclR family transcriptional regulator